MREEPKITDNEKHLLKELRDIEYGSMTVHVKNGVPWRVEEKLHSVMLGTFTGDIIP